jgi:hypothetical protein
MISAPRRVLRWILLLAAAAGGLSISGCETSVDPFLESDQYFTIYGSLDMRLKQQFVRVIPLSTVLTNTQSAELDAVVTSTDLSTGEIVVWKDSVVTFEDSSIGHVFFGNLRVRAGRTYQIDVTRSDGVRTTVKATVPPEPSVTVGTPILWSPPRSPLPEGSQIIVWSGLSRVPHRISVWYRYLSVPENPFIDVSIPYPTDRDANIDDGFEVVVNYSLDRALLNDEIGGLGLRHAGMAMEIVVLSDDWVSPTGAFDPEVLSQPGTMSNVENGFGFLGAVGRFTVEWVL